MTSTMHFLRFTPTIFLLLSLNFSASALCNTAPSATDDTAEALLDAVVIDVLANDFDPESEPLTLSILTNSCTGTVSVDRGLVVFNPSTQVNSNCTISYRVTDSGSLSADAMITVSALPIPPPPPPPPTPIFSDGFESGNTNGWSRFD